MYEQRAQRYMSIPGCTYMSAHETSKPTRFAIWRFCKLIPFSDPLQSELRGGGVSTVNPQHEDKTVRVARGGDGAVEDPVLVGQP